MSPRTIASIVACLLLVCVNPQDVNETVNANSESNTEPSELTFQNANNTVTVDKVERAPLPVAATVSKSISSAAEVKVTQLYRSQTSTVSREKPTTSAPTTTLSPEMDTVRKWESMEASLKNAIVSIMKMALPRIMETSQRVKLSSKCMGGLMQLVVAIRQMKPWAFYMLDAMSKPLAGTFAGSIASFGSFDECLDIVVNEGKRNQFQGQYCAMEVRPPLPPKPRLYKMRDVLSTFANFSTKKDTIVRDISKLAHFFYSIPFRMDLCVPSVCSKEDMNNIIHGVIGEDNLEAVVTRCEVKQGWKLENYQIAIACVFGFMGLMVAIGSLLETVYLYKGDSPQDYCDKSTRAKVLLSFSIYSNTRKLFDTNVNEERLTVLYGLKAISMMWMIWSNVYFVTERWCFSTLKQMTEFPKSGLFQVLINFSLSIDNLFFSSAVIVSYMNLKLMDKYNEKFSVISFIMKRVLRTIPSLMLLIALSLLIPILGSGPLWKDVMEPHVETCKEHWWTNILFINNFYTKPKERCFLYSTYYSDDIQLYIISALVLVPLLKYRWIKGAIFFILLFIIGSVVSISIMTYVYNLPPTMLFAFMDPEDQFEVMYTIIQQPLGHMGSYFIGIALGWFLYKHRDFELKSKYHYFGWPASLVASMAVLFGVYQWNLGNLPSESVGSLYSGFHRTVWSLTLAWFTLACFYGTGGVFRKLFTWKALIPLSRMTFVAYIIQYIVLLVISGFLREKIQPNHTIAAFLACGLYVLTYFISYACYISFDGPIQSLKSLFFDSTKKETVKFYVDGITDGHVKDAGAKSYDLYKVNSEA